MGKQEGMHAPAALFHDLGKTIAGPLLEAMVRWLGREILARRPDGIAFLARDGDILMQIWERLRPRELAKVPVRYLYASRRALKIATLRKLDEDALDYLLQYAVGEQPEGLLRAWGLGDDSGAHARLLTRGVAPDRPCKKADLPVLRELLQASEMQILAAAEIERTAYLHYLHSAGVTPGQHWAIVDIGWHGSLQAALRKLLRDPATRLDGYYFGLFDVAQDTPSTRMRGFFFEDETPPDWAACVRQFVELLEFFFSCDQPGLVRFQLQDGTPVPEWAPRPPGDYNQEALAALRSGIFNHIDAAIAGRDVRADDWPGKLFRMGLHPDKHTAAMLGHLQADRGLSAQFRPLAPNDPFWRNMLFWNNFSNQFKAALWRPGFWAQLNPLERMLLSLLSPVGSRMLKINLKKYPGAGPSRNGQSRRNYPH